MQVTALKMTENGNHKGSSSRVGSSLLRGCFENPKAKGHFIEQSSNNSRRKGRLKALEKGFGIFFVG